MVSTRAFDITPHDTDELPEIPTEGIFIGDAGNVDCVMATEANADAVLTFTGLSAGSILAVAPRIIKTTTTASNLIGLRRGIKG